MPVLSPLANEALMAWAHRALAERRPAGAAAVARAIVNVQPGMAAKWRSIILLIAADRLADATEVAQSASLESLIGPERTYLLDSLGRIALADGRLEEGVALLQQCLAANPMQRDLHYTLVSVLPHLGRFEEANRIAARGTLVACGDHQMTSTRSIRFPDPSDPADPEVPFERRLTHEPTTDTAEVAEAIYVVGCDSRYFLLFGEALANSLLRRAGARLLLHVHLVNPDTAAEALLRRLRAKPGVRIACSRETVDLSRFTERQRRSYLSCVRYLMLPSLLERYGRPMLINDADQLVVGDLRPMLRDLAAHDVGVMRNDKYLSNIFALTSASVLAVNATPGGRRFARTLRDAVAGRLADPAALGWHLDQACLAVAHLWHRDIRTLRLPPWIMDSVTDQGSKAETLAPEALFWSITLAHGHTARKLRTALFQGFLEPEAV